MKLVGKVALITGAAKGIGRAIAFGFAQEGAKVVIADIDYRSALNTSNEINDSGKAAFPIEMDVRNKKLVLPFRFLLLMFFYLFYLARFWNILILASFL